MVSRFCLVGSCVDGICAVRCTESNISSSLQKICACGLCTNNIQPDTENNKPARIQESVGNSRQRARDGRCDYQQTNKKAPCKKMPTLYLFLAERSSNAQR